MNQITKICPGCRKEKPLNGFSTLKKAPDGHQYRCRDCYNKSVRDYYKKYPEKQQDVNLRKAYGISLENYKSLLLRQRGVCAVCGQPETAIKRNRLQMLAVDHDHETGQIRGLLCSNCNRMLGCAREDIHILENAIRYLGD